MKSFILLCSILITTQAYAMGSPLKSSLKTRWSKEVGPTNVHREYPRPQMVRADWMNLNGLWDFSIEKKRKGEPKNWDKKILVPFPVESALSGVTEKVGHTKRIWYKRTVTIPKIWSNKKILLHFGAVDWETNVWVNDKFVGSHKGGYDPFSFDITDVLKKGSQKIVVSVFDPSDHGRQPFGKQSRKSKGVWYTPSSGIWQTVWLEPVPIVSIKKFKIIPDIDNDKLKISVDVGGADNSYAIEAIAYESGKVVSKKLYPAGSSFNLEVPSPKLWSPDSPFLYDLKIRLLKGGEVVDVVDSYFGMRKISLEKDEKGFNRLFLNNKPLFHLGLLDQGFWPDGLYTAPTEEAMVYDLEITKKMGFNMVRKHIKVEPARWYYHADKIGLMVWQDMPQPSKKMFTVFLPRHKKQFKKELKAMVDNLHNYPSIVMWVPFNEGWGQHSTRKITSWIKDYDKSRLINHASGWFDYKMGDVSDDHVYPSPVVPKMEDKRASVIGEYGGLGLPVTGHLWNEDGNWGYESFKTKVAFGDEFEKLMIQTSELAHNSHLSAAVYTQTTDVEGEINGLMTYDREVIKVDVERVRKLNEEILRD